MNEIAGNGLLHRRALLRIGVGAVVMQPVMASQPWERLPGPPPSDYGEQSPHARLRRVQVGGETFGPAAGSSSSPLHALNGTITPNSLHFERHHSGIPAIDPDRHSLTVFGEVERSLQFTYEQLLRYPMESHPYFLECSGNSFRNTLPSAQDLTAGELSGLVSGAEWTGVPLHYLLEECGLTDRARWVVAEGADASGNNRSVPMELATGRVMVALYQNGEPLRPAQGYPMRLFVPGCEGNISIKWLRSLKVTEQPAWTREETSKYTDLMADGRARAFSLKMEVKSLITSPSGRMRLPNRGVYQVSGLAWSGAGSVRRVEVSADGGLSWADAELQSEPGPLRLVRFRIPWRYDGAPAVLQSRATDSDGNVQPTRAAALEGASSAMFYHYNGIQSWQVDATGEVRNVYA